MKKIFIAACAMLSGVGASFSQPQQDAVLMTIGNDKVTVGDFLNVYKKNNNKDGSFDKKALEDYLDLYTIFRLKVKEAKEMGIDTTRAFQDELKGYRKTLAQPYLTEKDAIDRLVKEAYERMKWDVRTSHILVKADIDALPQDTLEAFTKAQIIRDFIINGKPNPAALKKYETMVKANLKISKTSPPKDTLAAFNKINPLKNMFKLKGHDFSLVCKEASDHNSKTAGGDLGYLTGLVGMGYPYEYENAAFAAKPGTVYGPFRTSLGYHLLLVTDKRPHIELHLEHMMFMFKKGMMKSDSVKLKLKVDSIYGVLKGGANFEEMAKSISEHKETAKKGGDLGWMAISANFPPEFKEAAFALSGNGVISSPVMTKYGWHIIKRVGNRELLPFDSLKADIKSKVQKDARANTAKDALIAQLKTKYMFKEDLKARDEFYKAVDSTFIQGKWKAEKVASMNKTMFSMTDKAFTQKDFAQYMEKNQRSAGQSKDPQRMINTLYKQFVDEMCIGMRESNLEKEYPDFRMLMEEYRDGILLFNLTDQKVWTKAIKDTAGAKEFHEKNKEKFMWEERLDASIYTCANEKTAEKVRKMIKQNKSDKEILSALNKDTIINVSVESKLYLKGDNAMLDKTGWTPGVTANENVKGKIVFANIKKIMKPVPKSYTEARGLITSDYQSWLEKQWVDSLKKKYPVSVDRKVFDSIK